MTKKYTVNLSELKKFSETLTAKIKVSDVILLCGDLGSGKTTLTRLLIKNICKINKINPPKIIPSPTYSILQSYSVNNLTINHYDFYRINDVKEIIELGFEESIKENISIIEWPKIVLQFLSGYNIIKIKLRILNSYTREIILE